MNKGKERLETLVEVTENNMSIKKMTKYDLFHVANSYTFTVVEDL